MPEDERFGAMREGVQEVDATGDQPGHQDDDRFLAEDDSEARGQVRDRRNRRRALAVMAGLLAVILIAGLAIGGWYLSRINSALDKVKRDPSIMPTGDTTAVAPTPSDPKNKQPMTFVLLGSDSRGPDQGRSDVLMTAYVPGNRQHVYLTSYPRDLWVPIPGHGEAKINAAYAFGGPALTVSTVQDLTGIKMDHVALIDFERFIQLTEALGGVTVNNKVASKQGQYTFPKGKITIRGKEALVYVRQRHGLPNGDFDRAERQRAVVQAIIGEMLSKGVVANPKRFDEVAQTFAESVTVDSGLTNEKIRSLATSMRMNSGADVRSLQAPSAGFGTSSDGQSIVKLDRPGLDDMTRAMKNDTMDTFWDKAQNDCRYTPSGC